MTNVWLVGRFDSAEAASLPLYVVRAFPGASVRHFDSPSAATATVELPDIVLIVQHRPREFSRSGITELIASQPLASFVVGLGSWCVSSMRTESAWPEAIVVPLADVPNRFAREADLQRSRRVSPPWLTSGREDVFLLEENPAPPAIPRAVIVDSPDSIFASTLADLVAGAQSTAAESAIVIWDADPMELRVSQLLKRRNQCPSDCVVALTALPTPHVVEQLKRSGADFVVPKPFTLAVLYKSLAAVTS